MRMHAMMISGEKLVLLAIMVLATAARSDDEWPLVINADPAWQIQYKGDGIHFFSLTRPAGENVYFTFSKWPAPGGREQVSLLLKGIADRFAESQSTRLIPFAAPDSYELETIDGDDFSGEAATAMVSGTDSTADRGRRGRGQKGFCRGSDGPGVTLLTCLDASGPWPAIRVPNCRLPEPDHLIHISHLHLEGGVSAADQRGGIRSRPVSPQSLAGDFADISRAAAPIRPPMPTR
jgi:hypothetical protein